MTEEEVPEDLSELVEQAKVVAKATGRDEAEVLADLLDDGIVNLSNEKTKTKDLVTELKEAAELINTVKGINQEVSDNKVLNGGENKTEVKVETTLEGDIVDRAIASVERKAERLKKIAIIMAPIFLLLTGGVGFEYFLDSESSDGGVGGDEVWGCTASDADNFMSEATMDDGSCTWSDNHGGGGGPPVDDTCNPQTELDAPSLSVEGNDLVVDLIFSDMGDCGQDIEIEMEVWNGEELHDTLDYGEVHSGVFWIEPHGDSTMKVQGKAELSDLPDGDEWLVKVRYTHANADDAPYESAWHQSNSVVIDEVDDNIYGCTDSEATNYDSMATSDDGSCEYPPEDPCDVEIHNHYRGHLAEDEEQDAIIVAFRVVPSNCEDEDIEIDIELFQNGYDANYSHWLEISGNNEYTDVSHVFDNVAIGDSWTPRITASFDDEVLEQVLFWGIDVEEQEPELCEINLFWVAIGTNSTHATVGYDLDCGYEDNDLEGYNVSVQFLVYEVNGTSGGPNATGPITYDTDLHYIQGWVEDNHYITLTNFTESNDTHYDFYFYAIWVDGDGESQMIEEKWLNRELEP